MFQGAAPIRNQPSQRKKSPPHLPLPTPVRPPMSPSPFFLLPEQQTPLWRQAPHTEQTSARPSPPFSCQFNQPGFLNAPSANGQCHISNWMLPQNNSKQMTEPCIPGRRFESPLIPPWNLSPPLPPSWCISDQERNSPVYTPLYPNHENQTAQWPHRQNQTQMDLFGKPANNTENNCYPQRDTDPISMFDYRNGNLEHDSYYRAEPSQAGPFRKPLSSMQPQSRYCQQPSPPGKYRSDFMRRLMKGEAAHCRRQPNPYRLFNQRDASVPSQESNHMQGSAGLYPCFPPPGHIEEAHSLALASPTFGPGLLSPQIVPVSRPEASYRNTAAFVELTADGLLEAARWDISGAPFSGNLLTNANNNSLEHNIFKENTVFKYSRPIESKAASDMVTF
ncbi:hypothetical protein EGW08_014607 [Elysia chlorotica]|uniref:WW domain-containing protein n=1 Tax=Elysia chlorotica TaxID=188477 RepID=A0A433T7Q9_ELYCH|nr:hypothetical protein EGW08_014607 [Elysia chlorotica]